MSKHSPQIRLANARNQYDLATQECAHWDYESDGDGCHDCCQFLSNATIELRLAKKAVATKKKI